MSYNRMKTFLKEHSYFHKYWRFIKSIPDLEDGSMQIGRWYKKRVDIIEYKYVYIKLVHAGRENWQYALTMQVPFGDTAL